MDEKNNRLLDSSYLPDNVPECHQMINSLRAEVKALIADTVEQLKQRVAELEKQVRRRNRKIFGQSSAKVPGESLTGTGKKIYNAYKAELDEERARLQLVPDENVHGGGGRNLPTEGVAERPVKHTITETSALACPGCGKQRKAIGCKISSQLDIVKACFEMLQH